MEEEEEVGLEAWRRRRAAIRSTVKGTAESRVERAVERFSWDLRAADII